MNCSLWRILLVAVALVALGSCSTSTNVGALSVPQWNHRQAAPSSFSLTVDDASYVDGGSAAGYELRVEEFGQDVVVSIDAQDAVGLKALVVELSFDPEAFRPLTVSPTEAMGDPDSILKLIHLKERGSVHYSQALQNYQLRDGYTGSGTVAQVVLRQAPTPVLRTPSTPPTHATSASILGFDEGAATLNWDYSNRGDYDQNSEVNAADLVPIAGNFLASSQPASSFPRESARSVIDGDGNGEINGADISPIAGSFLNTVFSYNVYCSTEQSDYPGTPTEPSTITEIGNVPFGDAQPGAGRKVFSLAITAVPDAFYWVRPVDNAGVEGIASNIAAAGGAAPLLSFNQDGIVAGTGTVADPYVVETATNYTFTVTDPLNGNADVTTQSTFNSSNGMIPVTDGAMNVPASQSGTFNVQAQFNGIFSNTLHFSIGSVGGSDVIIMPDPTDGNWALVPSGDGATNATAFILHTTTFNTTEDANGWLSMTFRLVAEDGEGTPIDPTDLTWSSNHPFAVKVNPDGSFQISTFANSYITAQDAELNFSNQIHVAAQALPN